MRIKIIHKRKNIPPDESKQLADFDALIINYERKLKGKAIFWSRIFITTGVLITAGLISFFAHNLFNDNVDYTSGNDTNTIMQMEKPDVSDEEQITTNENKELKNDESPDINSDKVIAGQQDLSQPKISEEKEFTYTAARPIIGFSGLYKYFEENMFYPESLLDEQIEGVVVLTFAIDTNGRPVDISIETSLHSKLDSLALEIISNMPTWIPAERNKKAVLSKHRIPLNFKLEKKMEE